MCTYNQLKSSYTLTFGASVDYVLMRSIFTDKIEYNLVHDRFIQFFIIHSVQDISSRNRGIINRSLLSSFYTVPSWLNLLASAFSFSPGCRLLLASDISLSMVSPISSFPNNSIFLIHLHFSTLIGEAGVLQFKLSLPCGGPVLNDDLEVAMIVWLSSRKKV